MQTVFLILLGLAILAYLSRPRPIRLGRRSRTVTLRRKARRPYSITSSPRYSPVKARRGRATTAKTDSSAARNSASTPGPRLLTSCGVEVSTRTLTTPMPWASESAGGQVVPFRPRNGAAGNRLIHVALKGGSYATVCGKDDGLIITWQSFWSGRPATPDRWCDACYSGAYDRVGRE